MSRRQKHPLRVLTDDERSWLKKIARSKREPSSHVARAKQLLTVADGHSYTQAAKASGRKSGDAVAQLVERFNREGVESIEPQKGGGPKVHRCARLRPPVWVLLIQTSLPRQADKK